MIVIFMAGMLPILGIVIYGLLLIILDAAEHRVSTIKDFVSCKWLLVCTVSLVAILEAGIYAVSMAFEQPFL